MWKQRNSNPNGVEVISPRRRESSPPTARIIVHSVQKTSPENEFRHSDVTTRHELPTSSLESKVAELQAQIQHLEAATSRNLRADHHQNEIELSRSREEIGQLVHRIREFERENTILEQRLLEEERGRDALVRSVQDLNDTVSSIERIHNRKVVESEERLKAVLEENHTLNKSLREKDVIIFELEKEKNIVTSELETNKKSVMHSDSEKESLWSAVSELEQRLGKTSEVLQLTIRERDTLEAQVFDLEKEITSIINQNTDPKEHLSAKGTVTALQQELRATQEELNKMKELYNQTKLQLEEELHPMNALKRANELEAEIAASKQSNKGHRSPERKVHELERELKASQRIRDMLRSHIDEMKTQNKNAPAASATNGGGDKQTADSCTSPSSKYMSPARTRDDETIPQPVEPVPTPSRRDHEEKLEMQNRIQELETQLKTYIRIASDQLASPTQTVQPADYEDMKKELASLRVEKSIWMERGNTKEGGMLSPTLAPSPPVLSLPSPMNPKTHSQTQTPAIPQPYIDVELKQKNEELQLKIKELEDQVRLKDVARRSAEEAFLQLLEQQQQQQQHQSVQRPPPIPPNGLLPTGPPKTSAYIPVSPMTSVQRRPEEFRLVDNESPRRWQQGPPLRDTAAWPGTPGAPFGSRNGIIEHPTTSHPWPPPSSVQGPVGTTSHTVWLRPMQN
eukprot:PhF_6_TR34132/c0_g1_i1/m.49834